jgi:hypothetical protein
VRMFAMTAARLPLSIHSERRQCVPRSNYSGSGEQAWRLRIGGVDRLLGAEFDHTAARSDVPRGIGKAVDVGCGGREDLLTHGVRRLVGVTDYYYRTEAKTFA